MNHLSRWALTAVLAIGAESWCQTTDAKPNLGKKLLAATQQGETATVKELLDQGADANYADKEGCAPLIVAAGGCAAAVNINAKGEITTTPVESRGTLEVLRALLTAGANSNAAKINGTSALMSAARFGRADAVGVLLDAHADPNVRDVDGVTALMLAVRFGKTDVARVLLEGHANPSLADAKGRTALHSAAWEGNTQVIELLIQRGAILDARTMTQATPLGIAAGEGKLDAVRALLAAGAIRRPTTTIARLA